MKKDASLIVGNWKSFILSPKEGLQLIKNVDKKLPRGMKNTVVVCPPSVLFGSLKAGFKGKRILFGLQDVSEFADGPHTGETSAALARAGGAEYVIVGHAERRASGETDEVVARKVRAALDAKLIPIVCVGESERDKEGHYFSAIEKTVQGSLARVMPNELSKIVIAYEPVWAIGAPQAPDARIVAEAVVYIRKTLATLFDRDAALKARIIYGGAVDATNAVQLLSEGHAGGFLVGRASTNAESFADIIRVCQS